jgi:lipid-binding SYLF domain-containing protein
MQSLRFKSQKSIRAAHVVLIFAIAAGIPPAAAEDTLVRLGKAVAALDKLTDSSRCGIRPEEIASAGFIAVIPGFKKGAAVGLVYPRGFISFRNGDTWSALVAITRESDSLGVQLVGEKIDIAILLSDRFTIGSDTSAAWGNGKSAPADPDVNLSFGHTNPAFAEFGLDGATLKPDDSGKEAPYCKLIKHSEIVDSSAPTSPVAQPLVSRLRPLFPPGFATQ